MTRFFKKSKKGSTLVELIGVMIVIAIIAAIAVGGIIAARDRANVTNTRSDLRTYENAVKQVMMAYPNIMKYENADKLNGSSTPNVDQTIIDLVNAQLETEWKFTNKFGATGATAGAVAGSGAIGYSETKRDAWGMPYALYLYTDSQDGGWGNKAGTAQYKNEQSVLYLVIASAGKNSTGVGTGEFGKNCDPTNGNVLVQKNMINNTDGIDDMGLIVRILDGDVYSATFGYEGATLGTLEGTYWVFGGISDAAYGEYYTQADAKKADTFTEGTNFATSLDAIKVESDFTGTSFVGTVAAPKVAGALTLA